MTIRVEPDELLVGNVGKYFRGCNLWVEYGGLSWLIGELDSGVFDSKPVSEHSMQLDREDREYLRSVEGFWQENCMSTRVDPAMPPEIHTLATAGVLSHLPSGNAYAPPGHFNAWHRPDA
jgi:hypothetical protein